MAASSPRVSSNILNPEAYRFVKRNFGLWATDFVRNESETEDIAVDITELAKLLQALKFQIGGSSNDNSSNSSGLRIEITCLKSKKHVVLIKDTQCSCTKEESSVWEVVATSQSQQSLVEVGCSEFTPLQPEYALVVKSILTYAVGLSKGSISKSQNNIFVKSTTGRRSDGSARLSFDSGMYNNSLKLIDVSSRYRSLDTLIKNEPDDSLPMPGPLIKAVSPAVSKSDTGIITPSPGTLKLPEVQPNLPQGAKMVDFLSFMTAAQNNLAKAMTIIKNSNNSNSNNNEEKSKLKSPGVRVAAVKTSSVAAKPTSATKVPSIAATPKPRGVISRKTDTLPRKTDASARKNDKYAHVQSTIPKATKR